jgi:general secretion pathway protein G
MDGKAMPSILFPKGMRNVFGKRRGGFTLVELLIVVMIIAILAGMMMLSTSSATDMAEAAKVINDLRNLKSAALLYYIDNMKFPTQTGGLMSLDMYMDRIIINTTEPRYDAYTITNPVTISGVERTLIGFKLKPAIHTAGVKKKLATRADSAGIFTETGDVYNGGDSVFTSMK